jgi:phosphohistidine phosphatase
VVTSPAPRALTTATLLSAAWPDAPPLTIEAELYDAPLGGPAACVSDFDDAWNTVILVGHNPSISHCADWLIGEPTVLELPTAGVVLLKLACPHWHDVAPGCGQLQSLEALEVEVLPAAAGPQASTPVRTPRIGP